MGGIRDSVDPLDVAYSPTAEELGNLPPSVDLTKAFPHVYNQGSVNSCHDKETEVLTDSGFKLFSELNGDELLATVNPATSELSFEKPSRLLKIAYGGPMICADNWSLNFKVTPDHEMLVRRWDESKRTLSDHYTLVEASHLGWYCGLMNRVKWFGDEFASETFTLAGVDHKHVPQRTPLVLPMSTWLRFLGIYLAEGTMLEDPGHYKFQLAAGKNREREFIRRVLSDMHQHYLELGDRFTFDNRRLYEAMEGLGLRRVRAPQKFVPEFVFHQSAENIREFLLGHWMGDGGEQDGHRAHYTSSVRLADDLHRLVFLSGDEASWTSKPPVIYVSKDGRVIHGNYDMQRVSVRAAKSLSIDRGEQIFIDEYEGPVYCAEVPTHHTLVTRRRGKILVSGNCTANAIAGAMEFDAIKQHAKVFTPSRLFIYYNERAMEGTTGKDAGGQIRDGIKSVAKQGDCPETLWPYFVRLVLKKPDGACYSRARSFKALTYQRIGHNLDHMRACLASGYPFVFGIKVFTSFDGDAVKKTGKLDMPRKGEKTVGLHAVVACGYDDSQRRFIVRNSWGSGWGKCLVAGTRISLLDGREVAIEDLNGPTWVYSYDVTRKKIVPALATPKFAGNKRNLVRVLLDNGESIECTDDHQFLLRNGSYRAAGLLESGTSLMPLYRKGDTNGGRYERFLSPTTSRWLTTHWMVVHELGLRDTHGHTGECRVADCEIVVHHQDFDGHNNSPSNLDVMYACFHRALHGNPILIQRRSKAMRTAWQAHHEEWSRNSSRNIQAYNRALALGEVALTRKQRAARRETMRKVGRLPKSRAQRAASRANIVKALQVSHLLPKDEEWKSRISATLGEKYKAGELPLTPTQREQRRRNIDKLLRSMTPEQRISVSKKGMHVRWHAGRNQLGTDCVFCVPNHKVSSVERIKGVLPTYDLIVPNTNNFALSSGVFVHNSGYFTIPYEYLLDSEISHDFWTIRVVR